MDVKKLNSAIQILKSDIPDGLIGTDIFNVADGQQIASWEGSPVAAALFNRVSDILNKTVTDLRFPPLDDYYIIDLLDKKCLIVILLDEYRWGMLFDKTKCQLGLVLNVAIPKAINAFREALD